MCVRTDNQVRSLNKLKELPGFFAGCFLQHCSLRRGKQKSKLCVWHWLYSGSGHMHVCFLTLVCILEHACLGKQMVCVL